LSLAAPNIETAAIFAAASSTQGHLDCVRFLISIGGGTGLMDILRRHPDRLESRYPALLTASPPLLDLPTKQAWLVWRLEAVVGGAGAAALSLVSHRGNVLAGLCAQLGVHETTGHNTDAAQARGLDIRFEGEAGSGDGLRREWFEATVGEILDPQRGLFTSKDGYRTLQPSPHSATTAGADHLSHFALLGRIAGLALYHREPLNASLSNAFIKAALGYAINPADLAAVDPDIESGRMKFVRDSTTDEELADADLVFEDDSNEAALVFESKEEQQPSVELKAGGAGIAVTQANKDEYLQLLAQHRLVGAIGAQVEAFRNGLGVFLDDDLRATLRACCSVADIQLLLCGVKEIDVDNWEASAKYRGGLTAESELVAWFWAVVRGMSAEERARLLQFCTGSVRAPATGFESLMGYSGQQQRFTVELLPGALGQDAGRLPTASTCFNTLKLCAYGSAEVLGEKLRQAMALAQGFDEAAVAVG